MNMNKIKRLLGFKGFTYKTVVVFHMKSGDRLLIPCDAFKYTHSGGAIQSYTFEGKMNGTAMVVAMTEIESISQRPFNRFTNYFK